MSRLLRFGLAAIILALAPVLLLQGFANARLPLGPPTWNGFALADVSRAFLSIEQEDDTSLNMSVQDTGVQLARMAFAKEPLATDALFVLAVDKRANGDEEAMRAILSGAEALDKRNQYVGAMQLEQVALSGDLPATFAVVDRLARSHPSLLPQFVQPLVGALDREEALPILREALEKQPVWAKNFWFGIPRDRERLTRFYELRQQTDKGTSPSSDATLIASLVDAGLYDDAFQFWGKVTGGSDNALGFVADSSFPPFGWDASVSAQLSMAARGDGIYDIYIQNENSGDLARQLVQLQPGAYRFSARIEPAGDANHLSVRLDCAQAKDAPGEAVPLGPPALLRARAGCDTYWLVLTGEAWDQRNPVRVTISDMQFQAAN